MKTKEGGFTLIELMIVVAMIAILSAMVVPVVGNMLNKSKDATTLGNLATLRATLALYHCATEGQYPKFPPGVINAGYGSALRDALVPTYIHEIPLAMPSGGHHKPSSQVGLFWNQDGHADDEDNGYGAGWRYDANPADSRWGSIRVLCIHKDAKGRQWSTF